MNLSKTTANTLILWKIIKIVPAILIETKWEITNLIKKNRMKLWKIMLKKNIFKD
jgi:hypothetical protein